LAPTGGGVSGDVEGVGDTLGEDDTLGECDGPGAGDEGAGCAASFTRRTAVRTTFPRDAVSVTAPARALSAAENRNETDFAPAGIRTVLGTDTSRDADLSVTALPPGCAGPESRTVPTAEPPGAITGVDSRKDRNPGSGSTVSLRTRTVSPYRTFTLRKVFFGVAEVPIQKDAFRLPALTTTRLGAFTPRAEILTTSLVGAFLVNVTVARVL